MASSLNVAWPEPAFDPEAITVLAAAFDEAWFANLGANASGPLTPEL